MSEVKVMAPNVFERHAQTALVLVVVALLLWVGKTTQDTAITVAAMRVEVAYLKATVEQPSIAMNTLMRDNADTKARLRIIERHIAEELDRG